MGILSERLPGSVTVAGMRIPLETDFRRWILFTELMTDDEADPLTRLRCAAEIVCRKPEALPKPLEPAFAAEFMKKLAAFALMSEALPAEDGASGNVGSENPAFDFEIDGGRIYAAFFRCYRLDLAEESLHWWKFLTLLRHLPPDCEFMRVVRLRCTDLSQIEDDRARRQMRRVKAAVRIRKNPTSRRDERAERTEGAWYCG